jgi:hypothetical protein
LHVDAIVALKGFCLLAGIAGDRKDSFESWQIVGQESWMRFASRAEIGFYP